MYLTLLRAPAHLYFNLLRTTAYAQPHRVQSAFGRIYEPHRLDFSMRQLVEISRGRPLGIPSQRG